MWAGTALWVHFGRITGIFSCHVFKKTISLCHLPSAHPQSTNGHLQSCSGGICQQCPLCLWYPAKIHWISFIWLGHLAFVCSDQFLWLTTSGLSNMHYVYVAAAMSPWFWDCRILFNYEQMLKILLPALLWNDFCSGYLDRHSDTVCQELAFNMSQTCSLAALFNYRSSLKLALSSLENSFLKVAEKALEDLMTL